MAFNVLLMDIHYSVRTLGAIIIALDAALKRQATKKLDDEITEMSCYFCGTFASKGQYPTFAILRCKDRG